LRWKLLFHREIRDDTPITFEVGFDMGVALEPSLFGVAPVFRKADDPWYGDPVLNEPEDLKKLELPDFFKSGIMPQVHRLHAGINDLVQDRIPVRFPGWARGPWSVACMLRGFTPLYLDLIENPEFVHGLMQRIVEARMQFERQRCAYLGIDIGSAEYTWPYVVYRPTANSAQYNDEVDGNLISAKTHAEFILPYEKQLAEFYGGLSYYHSCGNMSPFFAGLATLPNLGKIHVSHASELKDAIRAGGFAVLEKSLNPYDDVLDATEGHVRDKLARIRETYPGPNLEIWADAIYVGGRDTVEKAKRVVNVFRQVFA
jgi:uroporphyrinogen-III decarboxylase